MTNVQYFIVCGLSLIVLVNAQSQNEVRERERAESLAWEAPNFLKKMYPYFVSGFDVDGTPINIFEYGHWDVRETMEKGADSYEVKAFANYTQQMWNRFAESPHTFKTGKDDFLIIVDFDGYDNRQFAHPPTIAKALDMTRQFVLANSRGIEYFKGMFLVNSNYLFSTVYQLCRPILGNLATKIQLYGTNKEKWLPEVRKYAPKDQIPEWLGGVANHKPVKVYG